MKLFLQSLQRSAVFIACLSLNHVASATIWSGASGTDINWSTPGNWLELTSPTGTDVIFGGTGSVGTAGTVNNTVDTEQSTASLLFTNGPSQFHTTLIPAGLTLNNAGSLTVGQSSAANSPATTVNMTGDGTLLQSGANVTVKNYGAATTGGFATLNLSGLSNFVYTGGGILNVSGSGGDARAAGVLTLAGNSNYISVATINLALGTGNGGPGGSAINLGTGTNIINVGTVNLVAGKVNTASIKFFGATGGLRLRGAGGTDSDRANFLIANRNNTGTGTPSGTLDLTGGHPVDVKAGTITIGQCTGSNPSSAQGINGQVRFDTGTIDATTINMAVNSQANCSTTGTLTVGTGGTLVVENVSLVNQTGGTGTGNLNVGGNMVCAGSVIKTSSAGTGNVTITNGSLSVAGTIGTSGNPINTFNATNSAMTLSMTVSPPVSVGVLNADGPTNRINVTTVPTVAGYPSQFPVIKYATASGNLNTFGLGTLPSPYVGYISNNVANGSIDLVLTAGVTPARSIVWTGTPTGDWDVANTPNWLFNGSSAVFNQNDFVNFTDSATGTTTVNLTTTLTPSSITVSNNTKNYTFTGGGSLSGVAGLNKDGSGTLLLDNSGNNDFSGPINIEAGIVQVGNGSLGTGAVNNDGVLVFNRSDSPTVANAISGTGSLTNVGSGVLTLSGANSFAGKVTVTQGTLRTGSATALGATNNGTLIANGATLDVNAQNLGAESVTVQGVGTGLGGIVNLSTTQQLNALRYITLTGDTTFGGYGRWDIRGPNTADPLGAGLSTGGQPFKLTKLGVAQQISLVGVTVDPALGDIDVLEGTFGVETATTSLGDPAKTLTVASGARLQFHNMTNLLNKKIVLNGDAFNETLRNNSGANTVVGTITVGGDCIFAVVGTSLTLNNIDGTGSITKSGAAPLILNGTASPAGGITVAAGTFVLNGIMDSPLTSISGANISGSGTSHALVTAGGGVFPGDTNVIGTLTAGTLVLEGGSLNYDLSNSTAVGGGTNDLIVVNGNLTLNGGTIVINPLALLQTGVPYRLISYTGSLILNSAPFVQNQGAYTFTLDTATPGQVNVIAAGGPPVWNGGSATTSNWSDPANWNGTSIVPNDILYFAGNNRLNNTNDTAAGTTYSDIGFNTGAGAFVLNGNPVVLGGNIINNSANSQTVNIGLSFNTTRTLNGVNGPLIIGGGVTNTANLTTLALAGSGILTNLLGGETSTMTNTLSMNSANGNWTLMDNPSSTPITVPWNIDILAGTFTVGSASSAPVLTSTTVNGVPQDHRVGNVAGAVATLNIHGGTLTTVARLNTGTAGGATGIVNQVGGTFTIGNQFQGANGAATSVSIVNLSGGTMNIGTAATPTSSFFVASRGPGELTVTGGLLKCGALDVSRSINSSIPGTVNLNGGTISATRVGTATANAGAGTVGSTATFNFNGGTLKAAASSTTFFRGNLASPAVPITAIVKSGGAIIDDGGFAISILEPLLHDTALGATADGGLSKNGIGTVTLTATSTYTGNTVVNEGTLVVNGSLGTTAVAVNNTATLEGTGSFGGNITVNAGGTISPATAGVIGTLTSSGNVLLQGITAMDVSKTAGTKDLLSAGSITYGGTLSVANLAGTLVAGDSFKLFNGSSYSGAFSSVTPSPGPDLGWDTSTLTTDGTLRVVTGGVNTTPTNFTASVSGNQLTLAWPADHTGWRLQVQTNSISTGLSTNWIDVPGSTSVNSVTTTIDPTVGTVFYRMVYP